VENPTNPASLPSGQVLDTSRRFVPTTQIGITIAEILAVMNLSDTMKSFETLAEDLSRVARRDKPWTKKYVHSVYHGSIAPSPEFVHAVTALAQLVDGEHPGVAGAERVWVMANPGEVLQGALIPAGAKTIKCARPGCPVWFVRIHPRQKYHDPSCGIAARKESKDGHRPAK
jgi:hypothetical protein